MKRIRLAPLGKADRHLVEAARVALAGAFAAPVDRFEPRIDLAATYHEERNQYHSTAILEQLARVDGKDIIVALVEVDLYIPILTFVFGEAQLGGRCAVVSVHRMRQEFYGLPPDDLLTAERVAKTVVHETGHVLGLTHCDDFGCVMAASHSVEWLDLKGATLCSLCRNAIALTPARH